MTDVLVTPAFLPNSSLDSGDTSKLGPIAWKASRLFTGGGNARDLCMRDGASATGASWVAPSVAVTQNDLGLRSATGKVLVGAGVGVDSVFSASPSLTSVLVGDGSVTAPGFTFASRTTSGFYLFNGDAIGLTLNGVAQVAWGPGTPSMYLKSDVLFGWSSGNPQLAGGDVVLARDAANILAQRNGTNAQAFRVYGNATGAKYLSLAHNGTDAILTSTAGNILLTGATTGFGYGTGAGGAVTQITSRTTGVILNTVTGDITLFSAAGSATPASFTVTDSAVAITDNVIVNQKSGTDLYEIFVTNVAAGSFKVTFFTTGGTTVEQPVFHFSVIKGVNS